MSAIKPSSRNSSKDFFLQLLLVSTLYIAVINFISLVFDNINFLSHRSPGFLTVFFAQMNFASLFFLFPTFMGISYYLYKTYYSLEPASRCSVFHKLGTYLTVFLAAITTLFCAIFLLISLLNNNLGLNFSYKLFALLFIMANILYFYLGGECHRRGYWSSRQLKIFSYTALAIVIVILSFSLSMIKTLDKISNSKKISVSSTTILNEKRRTTDLRNTDTTIRLYWQQTQHLPRSLAAITQVLPDFKIPLDPVSKLPYKYAVVSKSSYLLCAKFELKHPIPENISKKDQFFDSNKNSCFLRTIKP